MREKKQLIATPQYQKIIKNVRGTFAIEGIELSQSTYANLYRIAHGQAEYQDIIREIRIKYEKRA